MTEVQPLDSTAFDEIQKYMQFIIFRCPTSVESNSFNQVTLAYLAINSLSVIGRLSQAILPSQRSDIINWVYSHQTQSPQPGGFRGGSTNFTPNHVAIEPHIASTHNALGILLILGDDLNRVASDRILDYVKSLQLPSGGFLGNPLLTDSDLRFSFCAAAISRILGSSGEIDVEAAIAHILNCQTHDGAFAYQPGEEGHGGATYCALAALDLWGAIDRIPDRNSLAFWFLQRQIQGFAGRPHKLTDTCYSFWIGAPLKILGWYDDIVDREGLIRFILSNYSHGEFRMNETTTADVMHTHFALMGLTLAGYPGLEKIHPALGFVQKDLPQRIITGKNE
jgi:geranylgeranyl transferase type-1 subunit beta